MISKLSNFNTLQDIQINFKLTLSKLYKSSNLLPKYSKLQYFYIGWTKLIVNRYLQNDLL